MSGPQELPTGYEVSEQHPLSHLHPVHSVCKDFFEYSKECTVNIVNLRIVNTKSFFNS